MKSITAFKAGSIDGFLLALGVALLPLYIFDSGGIQPAHLVLSVFSMMVFIGEGILWRWWLASLAAVSIYILFLESFYVIGGADLSSLMGSMFFFYNFFLSAAVYSYCRRNGISVLVPAVIIACMIAFLSVLLIDGSPEYIRSTGSFNNPNQLGYFSVCILSLTYLLYRHNHIKYTTATGMFIVAILLSVSSLSKAAMISNFLVTVIALKPSNNEEASSNNSILSWLLVVFIAVVTIVFLYIQGVFNEMIFVQRLQGILYENDSSLEARGYFALAEGSPLQVIFGLGEYRVIEIIGHEVHSTLGSILNNNGLIGFGLFLSILIVWVRTLWVAYGFLGMCCLVGPVMLYGIAHNGVRFTVFWVLLAASMAMASSIKAARKIKNKELL